MVVAMLTVDATIGTQGFIHDRCNLFPGLSDTKANNVFGSHRKNDVEAQVEFTLKVMERARVSCCCCVSYERQFASVRTQNFRNLGGSVW